jgi:sigma-B regulation protein RsbU (phosphoserine phosphatase)
MSEEYASSNISFGELLDTPGFMNQLLNNISSCLLLLNSKMELQAFNDPFKNLFSNKKDEELLYVRCGEALGCAYSVEEMKSCGETSKCKYCDLRIHAMWAYTHKQSVYKQKLEREFYTTKNEKKLKYLQYSIHPFYHNKEYYIVVIVDDLTPIVEKTRLIVEQQSLIEELQVGHSAN